MLLLIAQLIFLLPLCQCATLLWDPPDGALVIQGESQSLTHQGEWYNYRGESLKDTLPSFASTNTSGSVTLLASGTNMYWGVNDNFMNATFNVYIDGELHPAVAVPDGYAASQSKYFNASTTFGWHNFTIEIVGHGQVLRSYLDTQGQGGYTHPARDKAVVIEDASKLPSLLQLSSPDTWSFRESSPSPYKNALTAYTRTQGEWALILPPKGASHVTVAGNTNATAGAFTVRISPDPVTGPAVRHYEAKNYTVYDQYLVMADLDTKKEYRIDIRNDGGGELGVSAVWYTKKDNKLKVILPAVIVPVVVVLALVGAFFWWRRRKAYRGQHKAMPATEKMEMS